MRNMLLDEHLPLQNRTLHVSSMFKESTKPDIDRIKPDIDGLKPDIYQDFTAKTAGHISKLREEFSDETVFGRSDMMKVIGLRPSRASELLREMSERGIIEPVSGHGKGKYRFKR